MNDIESLVRNNVRYLIPYSCARDEFQGKDGIFMDANENPYGNLNRYPDPYQRELKSALGKLKGIPEEQIFLGNGSDEIIDLCYRIFCNPGIDSALTFRPSYGMYEVSAGVNDVNFVKLPLSGDFQIDPGTLIPFLDDPKLKLIFICSPNNPTGNSFSTRVISKIIETFSGIVIIDEAYIDFASQPSFSSKVMDYRNLIVMQTFSKSMGLAAARVGIAIMQPEILHYFNKIKPPYNISSVNQKAAIHAVSNPGLLKKRISAIKSERDRLASVLGKMSIIEKVFPSDSNFLLVRTRDADLVYSELIERKIIVRNRNKLVPGCIRITVGSRKENNKLIETLSDISI
jgi:histidinol-phosphate aminotransferase